MLLLVKKLHLLVSLCRFHHESAEFDEKNNKRTLNECRKYLEGKGIKTGILIGQSKEEEILLYFKNNPISYYEIAKKFKCSSSFAKMVIYGPTGLEDN